MSQNETQVRKWEMFQEKSLKVVDVRLVRNTKELYRAERILSQTEPLEEYFCIEKQF